jgi:mono/diheme cytochrome c family protein
VTLATVLTAAASSGWGSEPAAPESGKASGRSADEAFFERHIRPALIEHCQECHSSDTEASGGLALDSRGGWETGGDLGPSIIPGDPDASLLIRAIGYDDPDLQMPPGGKLDDETIARFRRWVAGGAPDPRSQDGGAPETQTGLPVERAEEHWAYRPIGRPADRGGSAGPAASEIDRMIDRELAHHGLTPAPPASRRQLIRRLSFDLLGLPPTAAQIRRFESDSSPDAYRRLVDRLLSSPHFGERFARHWMDVARYAESITLRGFVLPQAWRYRDYLVTAYAEDRPFDRMIRDQIAGDLLSHESLRERQWSAVATGFLAMGNTNLEDQDKTNLDFDHIDEQLETIGRAFLGQTIGCARCHDHKFDPIPTRDYYALAAVFRSTEAMDHSNVSKWIERPLPIGPERRAHFASVERELGEVKASLKRLEKRENELGGETRSAVPVDSLRGVVVDDEQARFVGSWKRSQYTDGYVGRGYRHDDNQGQGDKTATFEPADLDPGTYEVRISYTPGSNRASNVPVKVFSANESKTIRVNQRAKPPLDGIWFSLGDYPFEKDGQAYVLVSNEGTDGHVIVDAIQFLPVGVAESAAGTQNGREDENREELAEIARQKKKLTARQKELEKQLAARPKYLTIREGEPREEIAVRIRGDVHSPGEPVRRGFLTAIPPAEEMAAAIDPGSSGRRALADWIADPRNPLTARVYANRVWSWLMGEGLVSTENNFGTAGTAPSHPELLDWLARELIRGGWSTKHLVRTIVLSDAYRRSVAGQDSELAAEAAAIDPDNRLYWSANARRLSVESLRDAMLAVSGELDREFGGSGIRPDTGSDYGYPHETTRRSLYAPVFRNSLPPLFRVFDFADTSVSVGQRSQSTVATQSLSMLNHRWVIDRAEAAAKRWSASGDHGDAGPLVTRLHWACFGRPPLPKERDLCVDYLTARRSDASGDVMPAGAPMSPERLQGLIHSFFASIDFRYLE